MPDQIECVGGPLDGRMLACNTMVMKVGQESPEDDENPKEITHIYHLESGKYVYKGVRK